MSETDNSVPPQPAADSTPTPGSASGPVASAAGPHREGMPSLVIMFAVIVIAFVAYILWPIPPSPPSDAVTKRHRPIHETLGKEPLNESQYAMLRERMVIKDISVDGRGERDGVKDARVLEAMRTTPRERFVHSMYRHEAYGDYPLPIGLGQTISQPYIVAKMTELAAVAPDHRVLEIGTGSGYQAAILGEIAKEVYTIEIVEQLGERARETLRELNYDNVKVRIGDGYQGWPEAAPFDAVIVTAAPESIPQPLIDQLNTGGRIVVPVGPEGQTQQLVVGVKQEDGTLQRNDAMAVRFVPFTRAAEEPQASDDATSPEID